MFYQCLRLSNFSSCGNYHFARLDERKTFLYLYIKGTQELPMVRFIHCLYIIKVKWKKILQTFIVSYFLNTPRKNIENYKKCHEVTLENPQVSFSRYLHLSFIPKCTINFTFIYNVLNISFTNTGGHTLHRESLSTSVSANIHKTFFNLLNVYLHKTHIIYVCVNWNILLIIRLRLFWYLYRKSEMYVRQV